MEQFDDLDLEHTSFPAGEDDDGEPDDPSQQDRPGESDNEDDNADGKDEAGGKPSPRELKELRRRIDELSSELRTRSESEQFWAKKYQDAVSAPPPAKGPAAAATTEVSDDPAELVDDITQNGTGALRKRGFITREEVEQIVRQAAPEVVDSAINARVNDMEWERTFFEEFPDMKNTQSKFYQETVAAARQIAGNDEEAKKSRITLRSAAILVKERMKGNGGGRSFTQEQRIAGQSAPPTYRSSSNSHLSSQTQEALRQMKMDPKTFAKYRGGR